MHLESYKSGKLKLSYNAVTRQGQAYTPDGKLWYEGGFENGEPIGEGREYHPSGAIKYVGEWKHGKRNGEGKLYGDGGELEYEGGFVSNLRDGCGKFYQKRRLVYEGEWAADFKHGAGKAFAHVPGKPIDEVAVVYEGLYNMGYRYEGGWVAGVGAEGAGK